MMFNRYNQVSATHYSENKIELEKDFKKETQCTCLEDLPLAQAYVPFQRMGPLFEPKQGLINGTIFPDLYKPYEGRMLCKKC